jgi:hypothetical protein
LSYSEQRRKKKEENIGGVWWWSGEVLLSHWPAFEVKFHRLQTTDIQHCISALNRDIIII